MYLKNIKTLISNSRKSASWKVFLLGWFQNVFGWLECEYVLGKRSVEYIAMGGEIYASHPRFITTISLCNFLVRKLSLK